MIEAKFTPAPWFIEEETDGKPPNETKYFWINAEDHAPIDNEWAVMKEADAHLIAAAPELYEACQAALNMVDTDQGPPNWDMLRAAIAKARGEK